MKKVLITGVNGFVGPYLAKELHTRGLTLVACGIDETLSDKAAEFIESYFTCDLTNASDVKQLPWHEIDGVIHLAGLSAVGPSFEKPLMYMNVNTASIIQLFEASIAANVHPTFVVISSGAVYASSTSPITETSALEINSPYVVSKLSAELITQYYVTRGFNAVSVRPFNHIGPNQMSGFIVPDLIDQARAVINGSKPSIQVGDLTTKRDYTDVRDVVRAYADLLLAPKLSHTIYNICSGTSVSGEDILHTILQKMGREDVPIEIDQTRIRPSDNPVVLGSSKRIFSELGWKPAISLDQTIADILEQ